MARIQHPDAVTYNAYCSTVSTMTTTAWDMIDLLARIALPPDTCNAHVRLRFHGLFGRYAGCVQHCLGVKVSGSHSSMAGFVVANLGTWEVVAGCQGRGVFIQCRLAVSHGILCEVRKAEEAWLLWLSLLFKVLRIHCGIERCAATVKRISRPGSNVKKHTDGMSKETNNRNEVA
jgi:hypothetical protein